MKRNLRAARRVGNTLELDELGATICSVAETRLDILAAAALHGHHHHPRVLKQRTFSSVRKVIRRAVSRTVHHDDPSRDYTLDNQCYALTFDEEKQKRGDEEKPRD
jgi:hypothetical protein